MKNILTIFLCLISFSTTAQVISGIVTDAKNNPITQANVYLEGTYDGTTTNENGEFSFKTSETGIQTLVVSYLSFETYRKLVDISQMKDLKIQLRTDVNSLDAVILSAGTFSAGEHSKINALKPIDIVTVASALGDFVGALQTLPGTSTVAEDGRLFVRGGDAEETQTFIDGIRVFTPYSPRTNNVPTRGRYSTFLFDGMTFSTGGYSAEYGQALSGVLLLNTIEEPDQEKTEISIMTVGIGVGNTQKWKNNSLSVNTSYTNLAPYNSIFKDRNDWIKPFELASGEAVYRHRFKKGLLKLYTAFEASDVALTQEDISAPEGVHVKLNNNNLYFNGSYKGLLTDNWTLQTGISYTHSKNNVSLDDAGIHNKENSFHGKLKLMHHFSNRFKLNIGTEYFGTNFTEDYKDTLTPFIEYGYNNTIGAVFTEVDIFFSKNLALKAGLRLEHSGLSQETSISPRASMAYKTSKNSQLSFAYGDFYQAPNNDILKFEQNLKTQHTSHYIFNYQYNETGILFRAEAYYKDYNKLVKYDSEFASYDSNYNNEGYGFAKGLDVFWRDSKSIKNIEYWLSYSFLDSKRNYKNYPTSAQPNFVNRHNLSVVGKYWMDSLRSQVGLSYTFASGRTYTNRNTAGFLNEKTKAYNSLSANWAYIISSQKILYFSVNNVLGFRNINGYEYTNTPESNGNFARRSLQSAADQFFIVGFFWTISEKGTDNQLKIL